MTHSGESIIRRQGVCWNIRVTDANTHLIVLDARGVFNPGEILAQFFGGSRLVPTYEVRIEVL